MDITYYELGYIDRAIHSLIEQRSAFHAASGTDNLTIDIAQEIINDKLGIDGDNQQLLKDFEEWQLKKQNENNNNNK